MDYFNNINCKNSLLLEILRNESIETVYQPIVSLRNGSVLGYEALTRGFKNSILESPIKLFEAAREASMLWELEYLCRKKAIENAARQNLDKHLFINIDPKIIKDERFTKGITKDFLQENKINPDRIIFEITEGSCVEDYKSFRSIIDNYRNQGYRIAIDDTGAGYSGLRMLAETQPNYIKIDMELIRDIDKKSINRVLLKTLNDFAKAVSMSIIAEGIETYEELSTIIDMGIEYGQGYLLQRPQIALCDIPNDIRVFIKKAFLESELKIHRFTGCVAI